MFKSIVETYNQIIDIINRGAIVYDRTSKFVIILFDDIKTGRLNLYSNSSNIEERKSTNRNDRMVSKKLEKLSRQNIKSSNKDILNVQLISKNIKNRKKNPKYDKIRSNINDIINR